MMEKFETYLWKYSKTDNQNKASRSILLVVLFHERKKANGANGVSCTVTLRNHCFHHRNKGFTNLVFKDLSI